MYKEAEKQRKNCVIESIRSIGEAEVLKSKGDFYLIAVDALPKSRYNRTLKRKSETDDISYEKFIKEEERERTSKEKHKQNLEACLEIADFVLYNNGSLREFKEKIEKLYKKIISKNVRPNWDEYFTKMASLIAERSTCLRHNVGAVIVKNKRVLTTGYNGAVKGEKDCLQLGCNKDKMGLDSGIGSEECRAVHAEQNAIIQAALHGINTEGATLYCTTIPCRMCAKEIVNSGIKEVITYSDYPGTKGSIDFLKKCGVKIKNISRPDNRISFKD